MRNGSAQQELEEALLRFFRDKAPLEPGDRLLVAFSGGPDSLALVLGLSPLLAPLRARLLAFHIDHCLDPGSGERACSARMLAATLAIPWDEAKIPVRDLRHPRESLEAAGRRLRYQKLEEVRQKIGARYIITAHHRDDQAETVVLRLAFGSGLEGLAGINSFDGTVVRPLLGQPRNLLEEVVASSRLGAIQDPTNSNLKVPRNRVRHLTLPRLEQEVPGLREQLIQISAAADQARKNIRIRLQHLLQPRIELQSVGVERRRLEAIPESLLPLAWSFLHRSAGLPYPPRARTGRELLRQLRLSSPISCDGGQGWRWQEVEGWLILARKPTLVPPETPYFTYTLEIPGELEISEISRRFRITRREVSPWMRSGERDRVGIALPLAPGDRVTIRNRRPGDRLRPLGRTRERKLKDLLIDRRWPREARDRIPLLCVGDQIVWVPGLTIDDRYRLTKAHTRAWAAELETP